MQPMSSKLCQRYRVRMALVCDNCRIIQMLWMSIIEQWVFNEGTVVQPILRAVVRRARPKEVIKVR